MIIIIIIDNFIKKTIKILFTINSLNNNNNSLNNNNNNNNNNNKSLIILSLMGLFRDNETNEFKWQNNKIKNPNG